MAIVNHTGAINADETWAATDEHHLTGDVTIIGGASGAPIVVTIEPSADIYSDGDYYCFYTPTPATDFGSVIMVGTEANKIEVYADPTTLPNAGYGEWYGFFAGTQTKFDMDWVRIRNTDAFILIRNAVNDITNNGVTINNCCAQNCEDLFYVGGGVAAVDLSIDDLLVVDGMYAHDIRHGILDTSSQDVDFRGANLWQNLAIRALSGEAGVVGHELFMYGTQKVTVDIDNLLLGRYSAFWRAASLPAGEWYNLTIKGFFQEGGCDFNSAGVYIDNFARRGTLIIEEGVMDHSSGHGIDLRAYHQAADAVIVRHFDFLYGAFVGPIYDTTTLGSLIIDNIHTAYNLGHVEVGDGVLPQPPHYQWWDYGNNAPPTNVQATPIFPLDVENVVEGAPTDESITITYDSKLGSTNKRLQGVAFIEYGTASGGPYPSVAAPHPRSVEERYEVFGKWRTDLGSFKKTAHSVTMDNLKAATTYYYKCCFVDPLGRIAEGAEGTFDTTGVAPGGRGAMPISSRRT